MVVHQVIFGTENTVQIRVTQGVDGNKFLSAASRTQNRDR